MFCHCFCFLFRSKTAFNFSKHFRISYWNHSLFQSFWIFWTFLQLQVFVNAENQSRKVFLQQKYHCFLFLILFISYSLSTSFISWIFKKAETLYQKNYYSFVRRLTIYFSSLIICYDNSNQIVIKKFIR